MKTHTLTVTLAAARDDVFSHIRDIVTLPVWSGGFYEAPRLCDDGGCWRARTPFGERCVALFADERTGVVDLLQGEHRDELEVTPVRVLLQPHGCVVTLTLFQAPGLPDEFFEFVCRSFAIGLRGLTTRFGGGEVQSPSLGTTPFPGLVTGKFYETWDFYTTHLGFRTIDESDCHVVLAHPGGGQLIVLREETEGVPAELVSATDGRGVWLCFDVADADAEFARLDTAGVDIVEPPRDRPWGRRHCIVRDPNGLLISLSHELEAASRATEYRPIAG